MKPKATVYAMMACGNSDNYTDLALESFLKTTRLTKDDKFYLFDNDAVRTNTDPNVNHIVNTVPQSFAKNMNVLINIITQSYYRLVIKLIHIQQTCLILFPMFE
jgi:hypothetical protein